MKTIILFSLFVSLCVTSTAQTDSLIIKLQLYKDLYSKGLIDSQEYVALKAKTLGLDGDSKKSNPNDTELFYDVTSTNKILPSGIYMSLDEIKTKHPSIKCNLTMKTRRTYDYENGVGGNVMLFPVENCIGKQVLKMDAWIYSDGIRVYANLEKLKLQTFFNPIITMGRFLAFFKNQTSDGVRVAGEWGGSIGTEIASATGHYYKKLYAIDTQTAMLNPINHEYMLKTLKDYPSIYTRYLTEKDTMNGSIHAKYLQEINEVEKH